MRIVKNAEIYEVAWTEEDYWSKAAIAEAAAFWRESMTSWRAKVTPPVMGYVAARGFKRPAVYYPDDSVWYLTMSGKQKCAGARIALTFTPKEGRCESTRTYPPLSDARCTREYGHTGEHVNGPEAWQTHKDYA
jgi:hypothetical protein